VEPGGGGRCLAISPPSKSCHQLTGFIDEDDEHPASRAVSSTDATRQRSPDVPEIGPSLP
jgi:hypothetical protein